MSVPDQDQPMAGQIQMFDVPSAPPARLENQTEIPRYQDVVLTAEQLEQAAIEWPDKLPSQQRHYMTMRVFNAWRHSIVVEPSTGRRAFGGAQGNNHTKRKKRVDEALVEMADTRVREILDAAFAPIGPGNPAMDRHKAAMSIAREAREVRAMELKEDEVAAVSDADVRLMAAEIVAKMIRDGSMDASSLGIDAAVVDADVVDD